MLKPFSWLVDSQNGFEYINNRVVDPKTYELWSPNHGPDKPITTIIGWLEGSSVTFGSRCATSQWSKPATKSLWFFNTTTSTNHVPSLLFINTKSRNVNRFPFHVQSCRASQPPSTAQMPGRGGSRWHPYPPIVLFVMEDSVPRSKARPHSTSFSPLQTTSLTWGLLRAAGSRLIAGKSRKENHKEGAHALFIVSSGQIPVWFCHSSKSAVLSPGDILTSCRNWRSHLLRVCLPQPAKTETIQMSGRSEL